MALSVAAPSAPAAGAGLGGAAVPDIPGVQTPDLVPVPDVNGAVEQVTGQLPSIDPVDDVLPGGGEPAEPPPSSDPPPEQPPAEPPAPTPPGPGESPAPESTGDGEIGATAPADGSGDRTGRGGRSRAAPRSEPAPARRPSREGSGPRIGDAAKQAKSESKDEPTLSSRVGDLIAALPIGVLIGLVALAVVALLMTGRSAWFARATRRLRLQRRSLQDDVGALQSALVPELPASIGGVGVAVAYSPAAGPAAGGDFHDVFELDGGKIGIVVGDIAGHGREALPHTAIVRYTIRAYLDAGLEPCAAIRQADRALNGTFGDGEFATAVAATYEPSTRRLVYSCAGHPQPIVIGPRAPAEVEVLAPPPIGIGQLTGSRQTTFALEPRSELWFFSDGLIEAHQGGEILGRDGLRALLGRHPDPARLLNELPGANHDDLTACSLRPSDTADEVQPFSVESLLIDHTCDDADVAQFLAACGLGPAEVEQARGRVAAERRLEGQVLIRVSQLDSVLHWRVERVDPYLGQPAPPVDRALVLSEGERR